MANPLVTVAFTSYQQAKYVGPALESVLAQTYSPLQIVISDDASTDRSFEILQKLVESYRGPHKVELNRNEKRLGIANYNRLMDMARGEFIVVAHSDDLSVPQRTEQQVAAWQGQAVSLVASNARIIDAAGVPGKLAVEPDDKSQVNLRSMVTEGWQPKVLGATLGWERAVFERFGPLKPWRSAISTDWILPFRALLLRGVHYVPEPLIQWRIHDESRLQTFLYHNFQDNVANHESHLANQTAQFYYMLETLQTFRRTAKDDGRLHEAEQLLIRALLQSGENWTRIRNQLIADGKQVQWVSAI